MEARRGVAMRRDGDARAAADGPAVVLVDARTDVERQLIASWARGAYPDATPVHGDDPALARVLEDAGDPLVVPARITWLPRPERAGRRVRLAEALALTDPRRPWPWVQR